MSDQICRYCDYQLGDGKILCDPAGPNVCEPCQNFSELEEKIKEAKLVLAGLVNKHQRLKEQANHNHDRLVHRLPPEIAGHIFELCTPEDAMEVDFLRVSFKTIYIPFILSSVCRRWRNIVLSIPQLWNALFLFIQSSRSNTFPEPLFVQKWIDRAGLLPLSINVYADIAWGAELPAKKIIDVLNQYADRLAQLKYKGPPSLLSCFSTVRSYHPQLHTLHLMNDHVYDYKLNLHPQRLKKLSIAGIEIITTKFDWSHLIELEMGHTSLLECLGALRRAPHLTHYTVRWRWFSSNPWSEDNLLPQDIFVHPNIHYLEFAETLLYEQVLRHLSCPSLTTLAFTFTRDPVETPVIIEFLKRSGCPLERLSLVNADLSTSDIMTLCRGMRNLQHLHVGFSDSALVPGFFALLAKFSTVNGRKESRYLSALRSLTLDVDTICDWTILPNIFGIPSQILPQF